MSKEELKYVTGYFKGNLKTNQILPLSSDSILELDENHYSILYRGVIDHVEFIDEKPFLKSPSKLSFECINNIQVNKPNENIEDSKSSYRTRIYSFEQIKFINSKISNSYQFEDKIIAEIEGQVVGKISSVSFTEEDFERIRKKYQQTNDPISIYQSSEQANNFNGENNDEIDSNKIEETEFETEFETELFPNKKKTTPSVKRNFFQIQRKWVNLFFLILSLIVLFSLLFRICDWIEIWNCRKELKEIRAKLESIYEEQNLMKRYISLSNVSIPPCGSQLDYHGTNQIYEKFYRIGTKSGRVDIYCEAFTIPDRFEIIYDGKIVAQSRTTEMKNYETQNYSHLINLGFTQFKDTLSFDYNYNPKKPSYILVRVLPNQDDDDTGWNIKPMCPQ